MLRGATILKPAKLAAGEMFPEARGDALALARAMRRLFESEAVIVTDGEAGCAILADGFVRLRHPDHQTLRDMADRVATEVQLYATP